MSHSTGMPTRNWFVPGEGIAREVITADIQRYLGPDALVRPGNDEGVDGYWITAYRTLTSQMVQDLKLDSQRWRQEVQQGQQGRGSPLLRDQKFQKQPDKLLVAYQDSTTHRSRQYYGPTPAPPTDRERAYQQTAAPSSYSVDPREQQYRVPAPSGYQQEPAYTYAPQPQQPQGQPAYASAQGYPPRTASGYPAYAQPSREEQPQYQASYADPRAESRADPRAAAAYYSNQPQASTPQSNQPMYSTPQPPRYYGFVPRQSLVLY
ncbi:hypothetical protein W97_04963 [Coniosporium apollinis CBS 100218]|uniref:Transcription factor RfeG n=1 Tax=Coniosporium apollinis (strain CBS 100218) TaxID=1168221 RepID=R7YV98_CONA1|nr:uncharacterized protein W97_04963 [Coniosporium apollinis CBS 100218]EON65724.1 hypothetical protein W97_04963 [Coniosporium apollinis CBS 100218]